MNTQAQPVCTARIPWGLALTGRIMISKNNHDIPDIQASLPLPEQRSRACAATFGGTDMCRVGIRQQIGITRRRSIHPTQVSKQGGEAVAGALDVAPDTVVV